MTASADLAAAVDESRPAIRPQATVGQRFAVLVVDDHELVLCGLRLMLAGRPWVTRCLAALNTQTAVDLIERYQPRVALVDVRVGHSGSTATCRALREAAPTMRIVLMTSGQRLTAQTVSSLGAAGFVSKRSTAPEIVDAIRRAGLGLPMSTRPTADSCLLSARQHEVLELLAAGDTNGEIAARLYLSAHTVKQHTSAVYRKLEVRNRAEAIQRAQALGLLT
jgi:DNA-binding NarL/FixJ family response regulator